DVGEPWFERYRDPVRLLEDGSPLNKSEQERLRLALEGQSDPACVEASLKQLGHGRTSRST
ncbi:MAG TPA: hypothetical protein VE988_24205, partial [Gemmataceae bacterium]|nr:hypothetical protein [Gemmataceae bacterium]